jgi:hypothetical protein
MGIKNGQMAAHILVSSIKIGKKATVHINGLMEKFIKVTGVTINSMD